MAIGISTAYGRWRNEQKAAGRRPEDGVTALFVFGKRGESGGSAGGNGRRAGEGWRLAEDDRRQRCAGLVGSWARMGGQFNGLLNTMPATAGLCWVYCVRTASVWCRVDEQSGCCLRRADGRQRVGQAGARGRGSEAIRGGHASAPGGSAGARNASGGNSAKAIREPGLFRWSGSAVRCPGGQAVFDGAAFTAKGEG